MGSIYEKKTVVKNLVLQEVTRGDELLQRVRPVSYWSPGSHI
jgi:hypothetical protein